jgi:hypothetical protein
MFALSQVISIPFNRNRDERAGEYGYVTSNNPHSWECGCLHRRFSRAAIIESNDRRVFQLQLNRNARRLIASKHGVVRLRSTNVNAAVLHQSNETLANWSRRNTVSIFSFGRAAKVMRSTNLNALQVTLFRGSRVECVARLALLGCGWEGGWVYILGFNLWGFSHKTSWPWPLCTFL